LTSPWFNNIKQYLVIPLDTAKVNSLQGDKVKKYLLIKDAYLVSHKCHQRVSALRFAKRRKWYVRNLWTTAKKHSVLINNYLVSVDGIYLICTVEDPKTISTMMQVLQSSASKEFASKRGGESSMWKGSYNATMVHGDIWIRQCMLLLDLHMVAKKKTIHPAEWKHGGWQELAGIKKRYRVTSTAHSLKAFDNRGDDKRSRAEYLRTVEACCLSNSFGCLETWTSALAVGSSEWIKDVSLSIPNGFKSIGILPSTASPLPTGDDEAATLTISKKRRSGYLNMISQKMEYRSKRTRETQA